MGGVEGLSWRVGAERSLLSLVGGRRAAPGPAAWVRYGFGVNAHGFKRATCGAMGVGKVGGSLQFSVGGTLRRRLSETHTMLLWPCRRFRCFWRRGLTWR